MSDPDDFQAVDLQSIKPRLDFDEITKDMSPFGKHLFKSSALTLLTAHTPKHGNHFINPDTLNLVNPDQVRDTEYVGSEPGSTDGKR